MSNNNVMNLIFLKNRYFKDENKDSKIFESFRYR